MKFKKLLLSASAIAAGSGLLATVLTSCAKASVDDKLKIELNSEGLLYNTANMTGDAYKIDYKKAIEWALTRSNNWVQFKNALAEEIVFNWFNNRMATKNTEDKNTNFRTSYDEWEYQINKEYNDTIQNCKNKYGSNWSFYFQNEYLAPLGGTEEAYKHAKMVDKIKADFISKVFAKNYFGMIDSNVAADLPYPHIYAGATKNIDRNDLRNPDNWKRFGFYARSELGFDPGKIPGSKAEIEVNQLAKAPDGDYATIQQYVFDRWFETEKPFFADAALFKYSKPKTSSGGKLEAVYDAQRTQVKLPTDPNEAFPFFGSGTDSGTDKAVRFFNFLNNGNFATPWYLGTEKQTNNGTITIPLKATDDSQTCLLVSGTKMFSELYTPYAMACGNLYEQMFADTAEAREAIQSPNTLTQEQIQTNIVDKYVGTKDDFCILSNFFYTADDGAKPTTITNYLDLSKIYPKDTGHNAYHCPLFLENNSYSYFYGKEGTTAETSVNGIQYVTNNIQTSLTSTDVPAATAAQPWVMELNESGMHILTIDGYSRVVGLADETAKKAELKNLVMYRLMQKQCNDEAAANIHADLLEGKNNLKTYFNDNFTNIVLEIAMKDDDTNVFRTIESYQETLKTDTLFLNKICKEQALCETYTTLTNYLTTVNTYEETKKCLNSLETANNKIYSYRSKQIANAKAKEEYSRTIFENGLLAPLVYLPTVSTAGTGKTINDCMYDYKTVNRTITQSRTLAKTDTVVDTNNIIVGWTTLQTELSTIAGHAFVTQAKDEAKIDGSSAFSLQYTDAKSKSSNRSWYKSPLVDKFMYAFMGNKSNTANGIKMNAYDYYKSLNKGDEWFEHINSAASSKNAFLTSYARSKVLSGDKNLATYTTKPDTTWGADDFYSLMGQTFDDLQAKAIVEGGATADDVVNYHLWQATVMYLINSDKTTGAEPFDNFYTILNSKIGEDETAIVGYIAKGYTAGDGYQLSSKPIGELGNTETAESVRDYTFNPDVDNMFDKTGYAGKDASDTTTNSRLSNAAQWSVVKKDYSTTHYSTQSEQFSGFLGLQTKSNNQLDSASGLQAAVFDNFANATFNSADVKTGGAIALNQGCWFQFAGSKDAKGETLKIADLTVKLGTETVTFNANEWFPETGEYAPVRKLAKKIREYGSMDDLRTLAQSLNSAYAGRSYFSGIAEGTTTFEDVDEMRMTMLKLLPSAVAASKGWQHHDISCFKRVSDVEAHSTDTTESYVFEDYSGKNSYKLLMTQLNKADALERTITPTWTGVEWSMPTGCPLTAQEFWIILFNMASESTVQQRAVTEIVKTAFGDKKLIVYDAQLYNQFDSVWIKDWSKKTIGA